MENDLVILEGNTLKLKSQGPGGMESAGSGEQALWSLFGALGSQGGKALLREMMDAMLPKTNGEDEKPT